MLDKIEIEKLLNENTIQKISEILQIDYGKLYRFIKKENLKYKKLCEIDRYSENYKKARNSNKKLHDFEEEIVRSYISGTAINKLAKIYKVTDATILNYLKRHNVPRRLKNGLSERKKPKYQKSLLKEYYLKDKKSCQEIANILKYDNHAQVYYDLKYYNIPIRDYKEASINMYETKPELIDLCTKHFFDRDWNKTPSSLEIKFENWCIKNNIPFIRQYKIKGKSHHYDFLVFSDILVELDGDYWHSKPHQKELDILYSTIAIENNFKIFRFTESEIKKKDEMIFEEILGSILNEYKRRH